jgi:hypothetical protein
LIVSFDIDGCVTRHTGQFVFLARAIRAAGGTVHFVTARPETDREVTIRHLTEMGFEFVADAHTGCLHMYPEFYAYPWESTETAQRYYKLHAEWKAAKCTELNVSLHFDDAKDVITHVIEAGVPAFHVV